MRTSIVVGIGCAWIGAISATARADEIRIVEDYDVTGTGDVSTQWVPLLDGVPLSRAEFYRVTGHAEIAARNHRKYVTAGVALTASMAAFGVGIYELVETHQSPDFQMCAGVFDGGQCTDRATADADRRGKTHVFPAELAGVAGVGLIVVGIYELASTTRWSALDAHAAAERYNSAHVSPYATPDGGGVMMHGRF